MAQSHADYSYQCVIGIHTCCNDMFVPTIRKNNILSSTAGEKFKYGNTFGVVTRNIVPELSV